MAIVGELITLLGFKLEPGSEDALKRVEKGADKATESAEKLDDAFGEVSNRQKKFISPNDRLMHAMGKTNRTMDIAGKSVGMVTTGLKSLGIVSLATSSIMSAWSINAAKDATGMRNLAFMTQLSSTELQRMNSVYTQLGLSAESFQQDAVGYFSKTGLSLDLEEMVRLADRFSSMSEKDALLSGIELGFSPESIMAMRNGNEQLRARYKNADALGHINTKEELERLRELNTQAASTWGTVKSVSTSIQSEMAKPLGDALKGLQEAIIANRKSIASWGATVGEVSATFAGMIAKLVEGKSAWESFNDAARRRNLSSSNPEIESVIKKSDDELYLQEQMGVIQNEGAFYKDEARLIAEQKNLYRRQMEFAANEGNVDRQNYYARKFFNSSNQELLNDRLAQPDMIKKQADPNRPLTERERQLAKFGTVISWKRNAENRPERTEEDKTLARFGTVLPIRDFVTSAEKSHDRRLADGPGYSGIDAEKDIPLAARYGIIEAPFNREDTSIGNRHYLPAAQADSIANTTNNSGGNVTNNVESVTIVTSDPMQAGEAFMDTMGSPRPGQQNLANLYSPSGWSSGR